MTDFRARQEELLRRHEEWVAKEGGLELPVLLSTYMRPEQRRRVEWLQSVSVGKVLEVGCSWGYVSALLDAEAAVDVNPHLIDLARLLAPERRFEVADARALPFSYASFTTVILSEVLEHLPWPGGVGKAIAEACAMVDWRTEGARVVITVPHEDAPEADSFKHMWVNDADHQQVLRRLLGPHCYEEKLQGFDTYVKLT